MPVIKLEFYPPGMRAIGDEPVDLLWFLDAAGYDLEDVGADVGPGMREHAAVPVKPTTFKAFALQIERKKYTDLVARPRGRHARSRAWTRGVRAEGDAGGGAGQAAPMEQQALG